jgi:hypothetical protein
MSRVDLVGTAGVVEVRVTDHRQRVVVQHLREVLPE